MIVGVVNSAPKFRHQYMGADLLIADECHRYASRMHRKALGKVPNRLGLTATLERADRGVDRVLLPYFGGVVYRLDYPRALADGVVSPFEVEFSAPQSRVEYEALSQRISNARADLISSYGYPGNPADLMDRVNQGSVRWPSEEAMLCGLPRSPEPPDVAHGGCLGGSGGAVSEGPA